MPAAPPPTRAEGAVASLVLGIVSIVVWVIALVTGILAIVFGVKAQRRIRESGGRLQGNGMAIAGMVLGGVSLLLTLVLAPVVFLLVTNLADAGLIADDRETIAGGEWLAQGFEILGAQARVSYTIDVPAETDLTSAIFPVDDADDPVPQSSVYFGALIGKGSTSVVLPRGEYALTMRCHQAAGCEVRYTLRAKSITSDHADPMSSMSATETLNPDREVPQGIAPGSGPCGQPLADGGEARSLPNWGPSAAAPVGKSSVHLHGARGEPIVGEATHDYEVGRDPISITLTGDAVTFTHQPQGPPSQLWFSGAFRMPNACNGWVAGSYGGMAHYVSSSGETGGLLVNNAERGCQTLMGSMVVDDVAIDEAGSIVRLAIRFEQHCEGGDPALLGRLVWDARDDGGN